MSFLTLANARLLHSRGWGGQANPKTPHRIEFEPNGRLCVYRGGMLGDKQIIYIEFAILELRTWTDTVRTGGGFIGGGFGAAGAAEGMFEAAVLNALTTRSREYAMLGVFAHPANGASRRDLVFGFRRLGENDLRQRLAQGVPVWAEQAIEHILETMTPLLSSWKPADFRSSYRDIDVLRKRGLLTAEQHSRLERTLAQHMPRELPAAQRQPPPPTVDRIDKLKILADLRASGAITEDEFQAEKQRLFSS